MQRRTCAEVNLRAEFAFQKRFEIEELNQAKGFGRIAVDEDIQQFPVIALKSEPLSSLRQALAIG